MKDFRQLTVWEKAHRLTLETYQVTKGFPAEERYGLSSQLRRSSASIASNLAEACGRQSNADFHGILHLAMGSATELEYQLLLSRDLAYLRNNQHESLSGAVREIQRMLAALFRKVASDRSTTPP
jgi:four helix bundle protein